MTGGRGDAGNAEHVTRRPPKDPPPCPQRCWEPVYFHQWGHEKPFAGSWAFTKGSSTACRWDAERKQWTECEGAQP